MRLSRGLIRLVLTRAIVVLGLAIAGYGALLLHPQPLFAFSARDGRLLTTRKAAVTTVTSNVATHDTARRAAPAKSTSARVNAATAKSRRPNPRRTRLTRKALVRSFGRVADIESPL